MSEKVKYIRDWVRTNGEFTDDGKSITYNCAELEKVIEKALSIHDVIVTLVCDDCGGTNIKDIGAFKICKDCWKG